MADLLDILKTIGKGAGDFAKGFTGISRIEREEEDRKLEQERQRLIAEQIAAQIQSLKDSSARAQRGEERDIIERFSEELRGLPEEQLAGVGQKTPDITPGEAIPDVQRSQAKDSKGRPIDVVSGGLSTGGPDIEAVMDNIIRGAPGVSPSDVLSASAGQARLRESREDIDRQERLDDTVATQMSIKAVELGFFDPETGQAQIDSAVNYMADEREFDRLYKKTQLQSMQVGMAATKQSMEVAKLQMGKLQKELELLEPPKRSELLQNVGQDLTALAQRAQFRDKKLTQAESYQIALQEFVALHGDAPRVGALGILVASQINEAFNMTEEESGGIRLGGFTSGPAGSSELQSLIEELGFTRP